MKLSQNFLEKLLFCNSSTISTIRRCTGDATRNETNSLVINSTIICRETTGPEIWYQTDGKVDILVGGVGTGGTITGIAQYLRSVKPDIQIVAVEPAESAVISGEPSGPHKIQGIGAGFIPGNLDTSLLSEVVKISSDKALEVSRAVAKREGIFVGISSGAAIAASIVIGSRPENAGKNIVTIIPSFGERYLSTALFADLHAEAAAQQAEPIES